MSVVSEIGISVIDVLLAKMENSLQIYIFSTDSSAADLERTLCSAVYQKPIKKCA